MFLHIIIFLAVHLSGIGALTPMHKDTILAEHNLLRSWHGCPPLKFDDKLNKEAQAMAEELTKLGKAALDKPRAGEGVSWGQIVGNYNQEESESVPDFGKGLVQTLYSPVENYTWPKQPFTMEASSFMQLVWKESTKLGIGNSLPPRADIKGGYFVFRYAPANYKEENIEKNVPPLMAGIERTAYKRAWV